MKTYIYILEDPESQEVRYVGKTNNIKQRFYNHLLKIKKTHVSCWIQNLKNRDLKPILTIIDETEDDWESLEKYWINQFKNWGFNLCNHTEGGEGRYGCRHNNKQISIYTVNGDYIQTFDSIKEASKNLNINFKIISAAIIKNFILSKKYRVKLGNNKSNIGLYKRKTHTWKNKPEIRWNSKKIKCIEDNIIFKSIRDAAKYYNVLPTSIRNNIIGKSKKLRINKTFIEIN